MKGLNVHTVLIRTQHWIYLHFIVAVEIDQGQWTHVITSYLKCKAAKHTLPCNTQQTIRWKLPVFCQLFQRILTVQNDSFPSKSKPSRAQLPPMIASGGSILPRWPTTTALLPSGVCRRTHLKTACLQHCLLAVNFLKRSHLHLCRRDHCCFPHRMLANWSVSPPGGSRGFW